MECGAGPEIAWCRAEDVATLAPAQGVFARALVCDLADPATAGLLTLAPTRQDLRDEARPGASDRTWFRARRSALRAFAARAAGVSPQTVEIGYDAPGAPRVLSQSSLFVSVACRGSLAALAVGSSPLGVDLEPDDGFVEPVDAVLHPSERGADAPSFLRIWTAKEAYLKAAGVGFTRDPSAIAVVARGSAFAIDDPAAHAAVACAAWLETRLGGAKVLAACVVLRST